MARNCDICNAHRNNSPKVEVHEWENAKIPFERVHVDAGPYMNSYFFVLVDAFSKFSFVYAVKDMTAKTTIDKCKEIFTNFGCPEIMVMDNGRNFRSTEFLQFLANNKVTPKFTAPYHPAINGQAEKFVQTLKNSLKKMLTDPRNKGITLNNALNSFLIQYRITSHCTTGVAPGKHMFNRQMRTYLTLNLPSKRKLTTNNIHKKCRDFAVGERVQCRNYSDKTKWKFGKVIQRIGKLHYRVMLDDGRIWERHVDQILQLNKSDNCSGNSQSYWSMEESDSKTDNSEETLRNNETRPSPAEEIPLSVKETGRPEQSQKQRRELPARNRKFPTQFTDFWLSQK